MYYYRDGVVEDSVGFKFGIMVYVIMFVIFCNGNFIIEVF